jgi:hypothetical protein
MTAITLEAQRRAGALDDLIALCGAGLLALSRSCAQYNDNAARSLVLNSRLVAELRERIAISNETLERARDVLSAPTQPRWHR